MRRAAWVAPLAALLLATSFAAGASSPSAQLTVGTDGSVGIALSVVDPNGSALRFAMDGNFTPLVNLIPGNASGRASILAQIETAQSSPFLAGLFGNHDGTVEPSEVGLFESLLRDEAGTIPSAALTGGGILNLTLNGQAPGSAAFEGVSFAGAVGADTSSAPITVTSSTTDAFLPEGTSGTLGIAWNLTLGSGLLAAAIPNVTLSVSMPAGTTITSTNGVVGAQVSNDPLGYGAPTASGLIGTTLTGTASIGFHPAFPLGDVLIGVAVAAVVAVAALLLWRRRSRRAREADDAPRG
ncbi:MAG: hypothetical protein L3K00_04820 [Thermoplasmata archaeon]|nr:hypothetical protein [Thermoplasmata archaeon]MCI4361965.1 hypothetical protein [Thermoplasmata archaeon]